MNILSIPLYYESPESFSAKLKMKFSKLTKDWDPRFSGSDESRERTLNLFKDYFTSRFPDIHKYNDILGYAELEVEGNDILIFYYLNGDNRKNYNKGYKRRNNKNGIFPPYNHYYGGTFKEYNNSEIKIALNCSFIEIEKQCKEWGIYVNLQQIREMINCFDIKQYLERKISTTKAIKNDR